MGYDVPEKVISSEVVELEPIVKNVLLVGLRKRNVHVLIGRILFKIREFVRSPPPTTPPRSKGTGDLHLSISQQKPPLRHHRS